MPASIGVNLRVTGHCKQGGRKYMEDYFSVAYQQTEDEKDLEYAFFGIFDGHGGSEAATFAKEHLMESIVRQRQFWSDKDDDVLKAIREGFIHTHLAMWREQEKWPKTASGLPSTAGTTASIAFIRRGKIFTGHVGDSGIILGFQNPGSSAWEARRLTKDHKPESRSELMRIEQCGGKVVAKSGVPRVVWNRPQIGHKGPITRSTPFDEIPFLAVARSLGDLWSYNSNHNEFVVSPEPDTNVIPIDTDTFRCLIFGTDGLWNMISASTAVSIVQAAEQHNAMTVLSDNPRGKAWINPSMNLVERALERWSNTRMRADNTSVVTLMLDPPGPPRAQVIRSNQQRLLTEQAQQQEQQQRAEQVVSNPVVPTRVPEYPSTGLQILTRYQDHDRKLDTCAEPRYTEEYLDRLHREMYNTLVEGSTSNTVTADSTEVMEVASPTPTNQEIPSECNNKPSSSTPDLIAETIQINVVSSSSDNDKTTIKPQESSKKGPGRPRKSDTENRVIPCTRSNSLKSSTITRARSSLPASCSSSPIKKPQKGKVEVPKNNNTDELRRSRSLGPCDADLSSTSRTRSSRVSEVAMRVSPGRKLRSRPPKRERNESDEENVISPPKLKRSRSLGPTDLSRPSERNLRERNILAEPPKGSKSRGASVADLRSSAPLTRSYRGRRSAK